MSGSRKIRETINEILSDDSQRERAKKFSCNKIKTQRATLDDLKDKFPEDIKIEHDTEQLDIVTNCYAFALGLKDSAKYKELCRLTYIGENGSQKNGIQSGYIRYLLSQGHLQEAETPSKGCIVLYFNDEGEPKHAGILEKDGNDNDRMIRSRWGNFSATVTHRVWHVPTMYGIEVKYYHPLTSEESENYFGEFLKDRGLEI
ncbi:MAG: hypothetical protein JNK42_00925 [Caedimonas sp.]|jgi:hypothetical protein|nr:hypothetical protein [Caedimonas sp.]